MSPDDTGKPNKLPTEAGDCSLFNDYVWLLLNLLHRNRHKTRLRDFDAEDRAALKDYEEEIDVFLWELCLHQTPQVELAAAAVDETRKALHDLLRRAGCGSWLEKRRARWTIDLHGANLWLFLRTRESMRQFRQGLGVVIASSQHTRPSVPKGLARNPDPIETLWAAQRCPTRKALPRARLDAKGIVQDAASPRAADHCLRACDVLLLCKLAFTLRQIGFALGLKRKTVWGIVKRCRKKKDFDSGSGSQSSISRAAGEGNAR